MHNTGTDTQHEFKDRNEMWFVSAQVIIRLNVTGVSFYILTIRSVIMFSVLLIRADPNASKLQFLSWQ